jgi:hypothetical protein
VKCSSFQSLRRTEANAPQRFNKNAATCSRDCPQRIPLEVSNNGNENQAEKKKGEEHWCPKSHYLIKWQTNAQKRMRYGLWVDAPASAVFVGMHR